MDFFRHQEVARRNTVVLGALFALAVAGLVVLVYLVACFATYLMRDAVSADESWVRFDATILLVVAAAVLLTVLVGSAVKTASLKSGGSAVAESLRGRHVLRGTGDRHERKLLNVVDEMAIASGIPAPPVYVLDQETGINAFAAGHTTDDAVIGVTRGCLRRLGREELQGVVAHEFSHILNGDMRMNLRLIGLIHGILALGLLGYLTMRVGFSLMRGSSRSRSGREGGGAAAMVIGVTILGAACWILGYVGTFFGNLIKAAVSRQREFLADASAVEFTRQPRGLSGALKKIGGYPTGASVKNPRGREISHMFFGQAFTSFLGGLTATHPPLDVRIRRLDPGFRGDYPSVPDEAPPDEGAVAGLAAGRPARAPEPLAATPPEASALRQAGRPTTAHVEHARRLLEGVPPEIRRDATEPFGARAVVHALLLDPDAVIRTRQLDVLEGSADPVVTRLVRRMADASAGLDASVRLPLLDIALPALRELTPRQAATFRKNALALIHADEQVDVFEWVLWRIVERHLDARTRRPRSLRIRSLGPVIREASLLLSVLAHEGASDPDGALVAFDAGARRLGDPRIALVPREACTLQTLDEALATLDGLRSELARDLLTACADCIKADREVTVREAELFRAIAESLGVPVPPLLPGQTLA